MAEPDPTPLAEFLRERDVACPVCSYNLRGVKAETCPECGHRLTLSVQTAASPHGWTAFLVLAFGWLLLASTMNTIRNSRLIWGYATLPTHTPMGVLPPAPGDVLQIDPSTAITPSGPGGPTLGSVVWPAWYEFVPGEFWFRLVWGACLLVVALVGMTLTLRATQTRAGRSRLTAASLHGLARLALIAFGIYAGTHVYWFLEEMLY
jgi:DNA-directed RNA polymerase subunit RPC12/RpoP